jgi:protein-arginine kinase activator protein McsA
MRTVSVMLSCRETRLSHGSISYKHVINGKNANDDICDRCAEMKQDGSRNLDDNNG